MNRNRCPTALGSAPSNQIALTQFFATPGTALGPGPRNVFVRATDLSSNSTTVRILVKVGAVSLAVNPPGDTYTNATVNFHHYDQPMNFTFTALGNFTNTDTVTFYVSGNPIGVVTNPPYTANWTPTNGGLFDAWAVAHRSPSLVATSSHAYLSVLVRPVLNISLNPSNQAVLTWDSPDYLLMTAPTVNGSWTDITGTVSPHVIQPTNSQRFFRLRSQ